MSMHPHQMMTNHHVPGWTYLGETLHIWRHHVGEILHTWRQRYQARQELARWSDRDLHDVGLSWSDIASEVEKPFWRA